MNISRLWNDKHIDESDFFFFFFTYQKNYLVCDLYTIEGRIVKFALVKSDIWNVIHYGVVSQLF